MTTEQQNSLYDPLTECISNTITMFINHCEAILPIFSALTLDIHHFACTVRDLYTKTF